MAVPQREQKSSLEVYVAPPIDEAGRERLKHMPGVVYRQRTDGHEPNYETWIEVTEGYDVWEIIDKEEEEEIAGWLQRESE